MGIESRTSFQRMVLAFCAALLATAMCVARHHVHVDLADTATYASRLQHRCGRLMLVCVGWALCEVCLYLAPLYSAEC